MLWLVWAALLASGGLLALFCVAFGGDDPKHKRRAESLVTIALISWAAAAGGSYWLLSHRAGAVWIAAGLAGAVAHLPILWAAIAWLYRDR